MDRQRRCLACPGDPLPPAQLGACATVASPLYTQHCRPGSGAGLEKAAPSLAGLTLRSPQVSLA